MNVRSALEYVPYFCGRLFVVHVAAGLLKAEELVDTLLDADSVVVNCPATGRYRVLDYGDFYTQGYDIELGDFVIEGSFGKPNRMSDSLKQRLIQYGVPQTELNMFLKEEDTA